MIISMGALWLRRERSASGEDRILFLIKKERRDFHRQILMHLTGYRNRTVHAGYEAEEIETLLYQLKRYVEFVLNFYLWNTPRFPNLEDATRFLSMPAEQATLRERVRSIDRALRFQSGA